MSTQADNTQGLGEILERYKLGSYLDFPKDIRYARTEDETVQAILGWVDKVVIGENEAGERRGMRYVANSNTARRNTLRNKQRNILREHGYKEKTL